MKAVVDQNICIGCGLCASTCPEVFSMNDEGLSVAILADIPEDEESAADDAADSCPVGAISVE
ncbi:MAG: ferredoxin [Cellulosilyticaceae bacterium]